MLSTGRLHPALLVGLLATIAFTLLASLAPAPASAEREDDEPMFQRLAKGYLDNINPNRNNRHFEEGIHAGAFLGWVNRQYWREFFISDADLNFHLGGYVQAEGIRIEGYGVWSDAFDPLNFSKPSYWEANINYMLRVDANMVVFGVRRNSFADTDPSLGFPQFVDEAYIKLIAVPSELQGEGSVNLMYTVAIHQQFTHGEGTMVELGFQTLSTNAWVIGDVLGLSGKIVFNHKFLVPWGR
ncbi:MAG: hypothetical protein AB7K09_24305, partial [Planctomycetota bacterium]